MDESFSAPIITGSSPGSDVMGSAMDSVGELGASVRTTAETGGK